MLSELYLMIVRHLPGKAGKKLRLSFYKKRLKRCGANVVIEEGVFLYHPQFVSIGDNCKICKNSVIYASPTTFGEKQVALCVKNEAFTFNEGEVVLSDGVVIGEGAYIVGGAGVFIGAFTTLATFGVRIHSETHLPSLKNDRCQKVCANSNSEYKEAFKSSPVVIGQNCFIASNVLILPATTIGDDSFVRTNSVVQGNFEPNSYIAGDPALSIKQRFGA